MASKSAEINFKIVPEKLEDITASWCQHILHEGSTIDKGDIYLQKCQVDLSSNSRVPPNEYKTAPCFLQLNQNLMLDCLLISVFLPIITFIVVLFLFSKQFQVHNRGKQ